MEGKVLLLNPLLYTSEEGIIKKKKSIDDTLLITLCKAFVQIGVYPTLMTDFRYMPTDNEAFPFEIIYLDSYLKSIFSPARFPFPKGLFRYLKKHGMEYDLIISSEVFNMYSLIAVLACPKRTVIWHEMARHNRMMGGKASRIWYNLVGRTAFRNVPIAPRTRRAKDFISQFCSNVNDTIFDHGVDFDKFVYEKAGKNDWLISVSQLVSRKQVDKIIKAFSTFSKTHPTYELYVCGEGEEKDNLKNLAKELGVETKVHFTGNLNHEALMKIWPYCKALLVYTAKDNSIMTIPESIVCETPIITTDIPDCAYYVNENRLGIVKNDWTDKDIEYVVNNNESLIKNCSNFKVLLSSKAIAQRFVDEYIKIKQK